MKTRTDQQVRFISARGICTRRAPSKQSDEVRWSMDFHYEATETATQSGKQFGLFARSGKEPAAVMRQAEWLAKSDGIPEQTY